MIQNNQLRIGNYVADRSGKICKVVTIHESGSIRLSAIDGSYRYESFMDSTVGEILITNQLLNNCKGLNKVPNTDYFIAKLETNIRFAFIGNFLHCSMGNDKHGVLYKALKYIHELQNLYFMLTNEELEINFTP